MHDLLIKNSPKLDRASVIGYAKELGLDVKKFTESIDSQKFKRRSMQTSSLRRIWTSTTRRPSISTAGRCGERPFEYLKKSLMRNFALRGECGVRMRVRHEENT